MLLFLVWILIAYLRANFSSDGRPSLAPSRLEFNGCQLRRNLRASSFSLWCFAPGCRRAPIASSKNLSEMLFVASFKIYLNEGWPVTEGNGDSTSYQPRYRATETRTKSVHTPSIAPFPPG